MGSKFISTSDGDLRAVSDGSLDILGATLGSQNLTPGFPIKIDAERKLYSTALAISDVVNLQSQLDATIQTPFSGTLEATDFKTANVPSLNTAITDLENKIQNINTSGVVTNITGSLKYNSIPVLQITSTQDFSTTGEITCSDLATSIYPSLNTTLGEFVVIKADVNALEDKTQNLTATVSGSSLAGTLDVDGTITADNISTASGTFNDIIATQQNSIKSFKTLGSLPQVLHSHWFRA
jgi:hypothetical protein